MKLARKSIIIALLTVSLTLLFSYTKVNQNKKEEVLIGELFELLNAFHVSPEKIDDSFSEKAFDLYIKRLDFDKMFFTQEDMAVLETYKKGIDDEINNHTFNLLNLSTEIIDKRTAYIKVIYPEILSKPFDFTVDETYETNDDKKKFAANDKELAENWRKSLKFEVLVKLLDMVEEQEKAKTKNDTIKTKTFAELEESARTKIKKRIDERFKRYDQLKRQDRLSIYLNSLTSVFDPHTNFFPPEDKDDFDIQISGKLEGIGATLSEKDGYIKVESIVPGSASWKQGQLQAEDVILKVGQGDEEPVDVVDMRLDAAVRLIRGPKGTKVTLTVKKIGGTIVKIPIIRDVVVIEETYAKSTIFTNAKGDKKIGYIHLPSFYIDFKETNGGRKCSDDVLEEIKKLKTAGVQGIIFDVRGNGGGSLPDVVKIGGFFIPSGPIVQVKSRIQPQQTLVDRDINSYFDGPLVVMIDEFSASASEIFAAAMQDYKRAIIVGSAHSWGKGSVQQFVDLDRYLTAGFDSIKPLGQTKISIQKFYRINGGSTQIKGVVSDIILPDKYKYIEIGEKEEDNPMKWDEIAPAQYTPAKPNWDIEKIKKASMLRTIKDTSFIKIEALATYLKSQKDQSLFSLNFEKYRKQEDEDKTIAEKFNSLGKYETSLQIAPYDEAKVETKLDSINQQRIENWHKKLKKDPELFETFKIIQDMGN
jgi:carboxyl-terminal processing protease